MPCVIPCAKLQEGITLTFQNVHSLIEGADLLYKNKKYLVSASLSVFAFEEMTKAELLLRHYKKKEDFPLKQWEKVTKDRKAHLTKIKRFLSKQKIIQAYMPDQGIGYQKQYLVELLAKFYHAIKTHVFYVDWKKNTWRWFPKEYPVGLQKNIASSFLTTAKRRFMELSALNP